MAFVYPIELEAREGGTWLYVLTQEAGISLYDHRHVAFLNMNHGPLDPLLKYWIHEALPFLDSQMVVRFFVLLLPFGMMVLFLRLVRNRMAALLIAGSLYLLLLNLERFHFLLGRSDPAALFFLCFMLLAGTRATVAATDRRRFLLAILTGSLAAVVGLINWRFLPIACLPAIGWALEAAMNADTHRRAITAAKFSGGWLVGFVVPVTLVFAVQFHGDVVLYGQHFFYLFLPQSGWGAGSMPSFSFFPLALLKSNWTMHVWLAAFLGYVLIASPKEKPDRTRLRIWLVVLAGVWTALAYGYYKNGAGGGLYYFGPFYVLLGVVLVRFFRPIESRFSPYIFLWAALVFSLPWLRLFHQALQIQTSLAGAREFRTQVRRLTGSEEIYSEDIQLLKTRYHGEVIDMGDLVARVIGSELYDDDFTATARRGFQRVQREPPKFVMMAGVAGVGEVYVASRDLHDLLVRDYVRVAQSPATFLANAGNTAVLYQLKSTLVPPAP